MLGIYEIFRNVCKKGQRKNTFRPANRKVFIHAVVLKRPADLHRNDHSISGVAGFTAYRPKRLRSASTVASS